VVGGVVVGSVAVAVDPPAVAERRFRKRSSFERARERKR
jgi:hypothetical protein